jgi:hypothetical protein
MTSDKEISEALDALVWKLREGVLQIYQQSVRSGNQPGPRSLQMSLITYMATSLSTLPRESIEMLRRNGIIKF